MLMLKPTCPVDYSLCNQTVTVYHQQDGKYTRTVHTNAFLDFKKTQSVDKTGKSESSSFLLVIPGSTQTVYPGDKVLLGQGPEIKTAKEWASFHPDKVPGLAVVGYADCKFWRGQMVHTEAGG